MRNVVIDGAARAAWLDAMLTARENSAGIAPGSTRVAALVTETAAAMFTTGTYAGAPRLVALRQPRGPDGSKGFAQPRKPWATLSAVARPIGRVASAPEVLSM